MNHLVNLSSTVIDDLAAQVVIHPESIVSRTCFKSDGLKAIVFGFDAGQELSEHTSSHTAVIQIIQGEAIITLGNDRHEIKSGAWLHMPPNLKHSVYASTPLVMLLLLLGAE